MPGFCRRHSLGSLEGYSWSRAVNQQATPHLPHLDLRTHQKRWLRGLSERFDSHCVIEWAAFSRGDDRYSPRLDLAVGPFSTTPGQRQTDEYARLQRRQYAFPNRLWAFHLANERRLRPLDVQAVSLLKFALNGNPNARCFLAIEIENAVSRKHLMGGIMNAVALGHLAVVVGWTEDKLRARFRARAYLHFLESVDKPTLVARNLLILSRAQADRAFSPEDSLAEES